MKRDKSAHTIVDLSHVFPICSRLPLLAVAMINDGGLNCAFFFCVCVYDCVLKQTWSSHASSVHAREPKSDGTILR